MKIYSNGKLPRRAYRSSLKHTSEELHRIQNKYVCSKGEIWIFNLPFRFSGISEVVILWWHANPTMSCRFVPYALSRESLNSNWPPICSLIWKLILWMKASIGELWLSIRVLLVAQQVKCVAKLLSFRILINNLWFSLVVLLNKKLVRFRNAKRCFVLGAQ